MRRLNMIRAAGTLPLLLLILVAGTHAHPHHHGHPHDHPHSNFVGEGTNELATLILQGYVDSDKNLAVSPLGYSALLAILAEGAGGETRRQLESALHLPPDRVVTRRAYLAVLERLREKNVVNKPELRNWFYVYKNHTVLPEYREVLREYYLTDVKAVSRPAADMGFQQLGEPEGEGSEPVAPAALAPAPALPAGSGDSDPPPPGAALEEAMTLGAMKEGALIETALQEEDARLVAERTKIQDEEQKTDETRTEQKPIEQSMKEPLLEKEPEMQKPINEQKEEEIKKDETQKPMNEQTEDEIKKEPAETKPIAEEKPMEQDQQKEESMQTEEEPMPQEEGEMLMTSDRRKQRELNEEALAAAAAGAGAGAGTEAEAGAAAGAEGLSGLSGNALVGKTPEGTTARMLLFNGMYFRGSWQTPFVPLQQKEAFYLTPQRKVSVPMMRAHGSFRVGKIVELDSVAVELPYEGDRYSLLVLLPNTPGGLRSLVADLAGYSLRNLYSSMETREVEVTLPCFAIETITRPIPVFSKFGVSDVFDKEKADLSGVSSIGGLYVQDLVQLVTIRVDNSSSALNFLTSSSLESRTGNVDKVNGDRPFVYFVRDKVDNIVMVAGKLVNPEDKPTSYS